MNPLNANDAARQATSWSGRIGRLAATLTVMKGAAFSEVAIAALPFDCRRLAKKQRSVAA